MALAISPLIGALAAGNTAIIKPSELTPNVSGLITSIITETFEPQYVASVEGGPEVSTSLLERRWIISSLPAHPCRQNRHASRRQAVDPGDAGAWRQKPLYRPRGCPSGPGGDVSHLANIRMPAKPASRRIMCSYTARSRRSSSRT